VGDENVFGSRLGERLEFLFGADIDLGDVRRGLVFRARTASMLM
jgi:hypothetical protein